MTYDTLIWCVQVLLKTKEGVYAIRERIGAKSAKASTSTRTGRSDCLGPQRRDAGPWHRGVEPQVLVTRFVS